MIEDSRNDEGGYKTAVLEIQGEKVYSKLKFEVSEEHVERYKKQHIPKNSLHEPSICFPIPGGCPSGTASASDGDTRSSAHQYSDCGGTGLFILNE